MNAHKRNRLNAAQNHVAGAAYAPGEFAPNELLTNLLHVSGRSQQGPPRLYALPDILVRGKFSKSHVYNLIARGQFPKPALVLGPRFTRWDSEVDQRFESPAAWITAHATDAQAVPA